MTSRKVERDEMGDAERRDWAKRLLVMRTGLILTSMSLMLTLLFGVRAWASLPERVEKIEAEIAEHNDALAEISARLAAIEAKLDGIRESISIYHRGD